VTIFAVIAALMCAVACLIVLRPLLWPKAELAELFDAGAVRVEFAGLQRQREDGAIGEAAFAQARDALACRILDAVTAPVQSPAPRSPKAAVLATLIFVPLVAVPTYWAIGTPAVLKSGFELATQPADQAEAVAQMQERIKALEERLAASPQDAVGWSMLGRSYAALGEYAKASSAFARADPLAPGDAQMLADYADALAMSQGRRLEGQPLLLLKRALAADPDNIKALLLAGTAEFEAGQYKRAVEVWERVTALAPQDTELVASLRQSIDEARAKAGGTAGASAGAAAPAERKGGGPAAGGAEALSGRVSLSAALADKVAPTDTVFIFARAAQGPRMPLAAFKLQVKDLPMDFRLDDSMAMAPQARISSASEVIVTARISKAGDPIPKSGDLEGSSAAVKPGTGGIKLEIREVVK
jgi:cytochrome c-type biogenesis protein CcmH